jgi:hypothetical protein
MRRWWRGLLLVVGMLWGLSGVAGADTLSITAWANGDSLNATNLNSRMTSLTSWSTTIANDNIKSTAAIIGSKLDLTDGTGRIVQSATLTTDLKMFSSAPTWNAAGVTFTAWLLNVSNSASAAASKLLDLQVDSVSKFSVTKAGSVTAASFAAAGAEQLKVWTYSHTLTEGEKTAESFSHTITAVTLAKVRSISVAWRAVATNITHGLSTAFFYNYRLTDTTTFVFAFVGASVSANDVISFTIVEAI